MHDVNAARTPIQSPSSIIHLGHQLERLGALGWMVVIGYTPLSKKRLINLAPPEVVLSAVYSRSYLYWGRIFSRVRFHLPLLSKNYQDYIMGYGKPPTY